MTPVLRLSKPTIGHSLTHYASFVHFRFLADPANQFHSVLNLMHPIVLRRWVHPCHAPTIFLVMLVVGDGILLFGSLLKFGTDTHVPLRVKCNNFGDPLA